MPILDEGCFVCGGRRVLGSSARSGVVHGCVRHGCFEQMFRREFEGLYTHSHKKTVFLEVMNSMWMKMCKANANFWVVSEYLFFPRGIR